jgi:hypothetical protein
MKHSSSESNALTSRMEELPHHGSLSTEAFFLLLAATSSRIGGIGRTIRNALGDRMGRNQPCSCGAARADGKPIKFKHCHGKRR